MGVWVQSDWKRAKDLLLNWRQVHNDFARKIAASYKDQGAVRVPSIAYRAPGKHCFGRVADACEAAGHLEVANRVRSSAPP